MGEQNVEMRGAGRPIGNGRRPNGLEIVRHQLLLGLHLGRLSPGGRAPSVRRLAHRVGLNLKTVHRAYTRLSEEGLLDVRPGSGTYIARRLPGTPADAPTDDLVDLAGRVREMARGCDGPPELFASFVRRLLCGGLTGLPVAVTECNAEQLGLMALDLRERLGVKPAPVRLDWILRHRGAAARGCQAVVTSECHRAEVCEALADSDLPIHTVAFDGCFPQRVLDAASRRPLVMVVRDRRFGPVFQRLLQRLGAEERIVQRVGVFEPAEAEALLERPELKDAVVHVSPLVREFGGGRVGARKRLDGSWRLDRPSLDRLQAGLAFDLARAEADAER